MIKNWYGNLKSIDKGTDTINKILKDHKIYHKKNSKGILSFEYNNTDQLDRLVMVIKANY